MRGRRRIEPDAAPGPGPGATAEELELGLPGEDRDRLLTAEGDAAFRWAGAAVAGKQVVVAGCGHGHGTRLLLDAGAASVLGVEASPRAVEVATRLYGERIRFLAADPLSLPLASGGYDVAVCIDLGAATLDPVAVIAELRRVLGDRGLLLASLPLSRSPLDRAAGDGAGVEAWRGPLAERFANLRFFRRRVGVAATIAPEEAGPEVELDRADWLAGDPGEDRTVLVAASDAELPELPALTSIVSCRDLRTHQDALAAWEQRARQAEADGSAKHWELVAAREAQRRLRIRLHDLEHRPLRKLWRVLRGGPAQLGSGPPVRASEHKPERWD